MSQFGRRAFLPVTEVLPDKPPLDVGRVVGLLTALIVVTAWQAAPLFI